MEKLFWNVLSFMKKTMAKASGILVRTNYNYFLILRYMICKD